MATEQEHPASEQPPAPPRKAAAKESLAFLTSGAKEKMDKTIAGMKGYGHIMTHPFNKQAKEEATAQTVQEKNAIADKQERIRQTAHMQLIEEKAAADGFQPSQAGPGGVGAEQPQNSDAAPNSGANVDSATQGPENQAERSPAGSKTLAQQISEDSSDDSSRGRARGLAQIPPDSQDYQSG